MAGKQRKLYPEIPALYREYRHQVGGTMTRSQLVTFRDTEIQKLFWKMSDDSIKEKLVKKPWIYESMRPDFPPGCRRLTPGPGYLEALVEENVEFVGTGIKQSHRDGSRGLERQIPRGRCLHLRDWVRLVRLHDQGSLSRQCANNVAIQILQFVVDAIYRPGWCHFRGCMDTSPRSILLTRCPKNAKPLHLPWS